MSDVVLIATSVVVLLYCGRLRWFGEAVWICSVRPTGSDVAGRDGVTAFLKLKETIQAWLPDLY
jgi:hypothetical protein